MKKSTLLFVTILISFFPSGDLFAKGKVKVDKALEQAARQYLYMRSELQGSNQFPKTYDKHMQRLKTSNSEWWCSGFYPGTLFYLYEDTGNKELYAEGVRMLKLLEPEQYNVNTHDVGFMMYCSYGNANRVAPKPEYKDIMVNSARSLISRFSPVVGCIKSHNRKPDDYVVIIDNMMNLELLFWATQATGDSTFYDIAVKHADTTLKNHFRADNSLYHGLNYNPATGEIKHYQGGQGFSEKSAWARGQAWGLYGYTMMYRETGQEKYLQHATNVARFIMNHPRLPEDKIPYWDFDAPGIPNELRDASAGALMASAFIELSQYTEGDFSKQCLSVAETQLKTLSSPEYLAEPGTNCNFILKHSVGNNPGKAEVDVPLTYADYYYVEALVRYKRDILKEKLH